MFDRLRKICAYVEGTLQAEASHMITVKDAPSRLFNQRI